MNIWPFRLTLLLFLTFVAFEMVHSAPPKITPVKTGIRTLLRMEQDYIAPLGSTDTPLKSGAKVDVYLQSGKRFDQVEITELIPGKPKNSLKVLGCTAAKGGKQKIQASTILHIRTEDGGFDVVQDPATKAFMLLDLKLRDEQASRRLSTSGNALWEEPSDENRQASIEESKALFEKARQQFPGHEFRMEETEFFLFFTDMPPEQITGYIANLDAMYRQMCVAFGVLPGKNIWVGKCPVLAFVEQEMFLAFEAAQMDNRETRSVQGLCHSSSDGEVVITVYRGHDPAYFATVLVHETAHGFVHRFRSNVDLPNWIDEGIADWIAGVTVPASSAVPRRQAQAVAMMQNSGSMGGFFEPDKELTPIDYGIASSLTQFMLQTDANLYRAYLQAMKEGYRVDEALKLTYGITPQELVQGFGNSIGIPELRP